MATPAERRLKRALKNYDDERIDEDYLEMYASPSDDPFDLPDPLERAFAAKSSPAEVRGLGGALPMPSLPVDCVEIDDRDDLLRAEAWVAA